MKLEVVISFNTQSIIACSRKTLSSSVLNISGHTQGPHNHTIPYQLPKKRMDTHSLHNLASNRKCPYQASNEYKSLSDPNPNPSPIPSQSITRKKLHRYSTHRRAHATPRHTSPSPSQNTKPIRNDERDHPVGSPVTSAIWAVLAKKGTGHTHAEQSEHNTSQTRDRTSAPLHPWPLSENNPPYHDTATFPSPSPRPPSAVSAVWS